MLQYLILVILILFYYYSYLPSDIYMTSMYITCKNYILSHVVKINTLYNQLILL